MGFFDDVFINQSFDFFWYFFSRMVWYLPLWLNDGFNVFMNVQFDLFGVWFALSAKQFPVYQLAECSDLCTCLLPLRLIWTMFASYFRYMSILWLPFPFCQLLFPACQFQWLCLLVVLSWTVCRYFQAFFDDVNNWICKSGIWFCLKLAFERPRLVWTISEYFRCTFRWFKTCLKAVVCMFWSRWHLLSHPCQQWNWFSAN